jgi:hypothetical protein
MREPASHTRLPVSAVGAFLIVFCASGATLVRPHQGARRRLQCRNGLRPAWLRRPVGSALAASARGLRHPSALGPRSVACRGRSRSASRSGPSSRPGDASSTPDTHSGPIRNGSSESRC